MATLLEYFKNHSITHSIGVEMTVTLQQQAANGIILSDNIRVLEEVRVDTDASCRVFTYYIFATDKAHYVIEHLLTELENRKVAHQTLRMESSGDGAIEIGEEKTVYSNTIYFYSETDPVLTYNSNIANLCTNKHLHIKIRSTKFLKSMMEIEKPVAFISHDSNDKDTIARRMAIGLQSRLCFVWYDEFSLNVGDSLRSSIEKGIKEAKKCILILTPNFLQNIGWTKKEFDSIFTREMIYSQRIILPVWHDVTKEEVYEYSPALADTVALKWPRKTDGLTDDQYDQAVEELLSRLHSQLIIG